MVGQRWDVRIDEPLDFSPGWDQRLRGCVKKSGRLHGKTGIDYFVHAKHAFGEIPPFVIGDQTICAIYRNSEHWITNTARGGKAEVCPVTATSRALTIALAVATPIERPRLRTMERNEEPTPNLSGGIELMSALLLGV